MRFYSIFILVLSAFSQINAQTVQCSSLAGGCSDGTAHDSALRSAIAKFQAGEIYGGGDMPIFFSSSLGGTDLTQISYSCLDGSIPPPLTGSAVQSSLQSIVSCPNQCGSVSVSSKCGFGVLTANDAAGASCFSKATNVDPIGSGPSEVPLVGTFISLGCWTDSINARALTGGSSTAADMSVEKCVALAKGFQYAGVEYATECYWGNTIASTSSQAFGQCAMPCAGSPSEICGDGNRIDIYQDFTYVAPSTTSSTSTPPTGSPTAVPSVDSFTNTGCFVDSISARVLVAGSTTDQSATGMTVEKCVDFAEQSGFKYAGVEYGGECYVGNTVHNGATASQSDCNMHCAGNVAEFCGSGNRIQIYEDSTWSNPVAADLVSAMQDYTDALSQVTQAIADYKSYVLALQAIQGSKVRKHRRDSTGTESIQLQNIVGVKARMETLLESLRGRETAVRKVVYRANSMDIPTILTPLVNADQLSSVVDSTDTVDELSSGVEAAMADDVTSIAESTAPLLNIPRDLAIIDSSNAIGIPAVVGPAGLAATGVFLVFAALISFFEGGSSSPVSTLATATTASSTTSSATATGTPYFIVAKIGTDQADFNSLVESLPQSSDDVAIAYPLVGVFAQVATFNDSVLKSVEANPIVQTVMPRDDPGDASSTPTKRSKRHRSLSPPAAHLDVPPRIKKRTGPTKNLPLQVFTPSDLQWQSPSQPPLELISNKTWFDDSSTLDGYNGIDYLVENTLGAGVTIYVVDTGVDAHPEFSVLENFNHYVAKGADAAISDPHGTCVASMAAGNSLGVAKNASLYDSKINFQHEYSIFDGIWFAVNDVISKNLQGKAVINLSFGGSKIQDSTITDWYPATLEWAVSKGIVVIAAAGNDGNDDGQETADNNLLSSIRPSSYAASIPGFMAVGSVGADGARSLITPKCNLQDDTADCLQAFALGEDVSCAVLNGAYETLTGTSYSAPQVAGLAAYLLSHPSGFVQHSINSGGIGALAANVETLIDSLSYKRYYGDLTRDPSPVAPNVIFNGAVLHVNSVGSAVPVV